MNASKIQSKICEYCRRNAIPYNNLIKMSVSGWPDLMIVWRSTTYFFEVKYGNDRLSKLQEYRINELNKVGTIAFVIKSFKDFENILNSIKTIK